MVRVGRFELTDLEIKSFLRYLTAPYPLINQGNRLSPLIGPLALRPFVVFLMGQTFTLNAFAHFIKIMCPVVAIPHALGFWRLVLGAILPALPASMGAVSSALCKPLLAFWGHAPPSPPVVSADGKIWDWWDLNSTTPQGECPQACYPLTIQSHLERGDLTLTPQSG